MNAIIYTRVSTKDKGQTTENQIPSLLSYCKSQALDVIETLEEEQSAGEGKKRPKLDYLLRKVKKKEVDVIVVYKLDRLARSLRDFLGIVDTLNENGVRLVIPNQGIDTDVKTPMGKMMMGVLAVFAEFERDLIKERVKMGIDRVRSQGVQWGARKTPVNTVRVQELLDRKMSIRGIAREMGVGKNCMVRVVREMKEREKK